MVPFAFSKTSAQNTASVVPFTTDILARVCGGKGGRGGGGQYHEAPTRECKTGRDDCRAAHDTLNQIDPPIFWNTICLSLPWRISVKQCVKDHPKVPRKSTRMSRSVSLRQHFADTEI
jgi:hypothetical protein